MIDDVEVINDVISALVMEGLQDYLSCKIKFTKDKMRLGGQPHLIKNMKKKFSKHLQNVWSHKTQGTPKF